MEIFKLIRLFASVDYLIITEIVLTKFCQFHLETRRDVKDRGLQI